MDVLDFVLARKPRLLLMVNAQNPVAPGPVRCRPIGEADIDGVTDLLTLAFADLQTRAFWEKMLGTLRQRPPLAGLPRLGYMLDRDDKAVGVLLLIATEVPNAPRKAIRCNVSSWYVEPQYRAYAPLLVNNALKHKDVTYINVTPAPHTWPILAAQGYKRFSNGLFVAVPLLCRGGRGEDVRVVPVGAPEADDRSLPDRDLLVAHAGYGCISFWCVADGVAQPFVFRPKLVKRAVPCAQLVYCTSIDEVVRFAAPLGRRLLRHGMPLISIDANGPVPGLVGRYLDGVKPRYYRGPDVPRLGDLAYTESAMFGV